MFKSGVLDVALKQLTMTIRRVTDLKLHINLF